MTRNFLILWMDKILHHFETMGQPYCLVFTGSSLQGLLGGAGICPSTVFLWRLKQQDNCNSPDFLLRVFGFLLSLEQRSHGN